EADHARIVAELRAMGACVLPSLEAPPPHPGFQPGVQFDMLHLRIKQHPMAEGRHRVDLDLTGDGAPRAATAEIAFGLSPQDEEDLRWYLEDFLQYPQEPAPVIAQRVEGRMS